MTGSKSNDRAGILAILLGVIALGLAVTSTAIFKIPPPWPSAPIPEPQEVVEGGKTFEWKGAKVTIGGTTKVVDSPPAPPPAFSSKAVFVTTAVIALAGIAAGLISARRERSYFFGGPAVALCSVALLWHYILIGVTVGVAFIVVVIVLASLADGLPV